MLLIKTVHSFLPLFIFFLYHVLFDFFFGYLLVFLSYPICTLAILLFVFPVSSPWSFLSLTALTLAAKNA